MGAAVMVTFDATINLGHVITFFGFIIGGLAVVWALKYDVRYLSNRLVSVETKLEKFGAALTALAVQEERMNSIDRRLNDLQHGRGFVLDGLPRAMKSGD
jgi:hypothetical protein